MTHHPIVLVLIGAAMSWLPSVLRATKPQEGAELWVTNYSYQRYDGKAYRLDILATGPGETPPITRVIDYAANSVEGVDHDRTGHLYVGMRYKQSRASASIVKYDDQTGAEIQRYTGFAYPDGYEIFPRHENSWVKIGSGKRPRL